MKLRGRRTFSLPDDLLTGVELLAEMQDEPQSTLVSRALRAYFDGLPEEVRERLRVANNERRREQTKERIAKEQPVTLVAVCPNCLDSSNLVNFSDGHWRCNLCLWEGT